MIKIKRRSPIGAILLLKGVRGPVMRDKKLISSGVPMARGRGRGAVLGFLRGAGTRSWKREATLLLALLVTLTAGYLTVSHFAFQAVDDLAGTCTARFEIELENADIDPLTKALPRSLCECLALSLLDKNGMVRLAMVNRRMLDPLALEPVTEKDEEACINALWGPDVELARRLSLSL
ncbi:MAG: hypothetical protein ABWY46_06255 [Pseudomonas sp.]